MQLDQYLKAEGRGALTRLSTAINSHPPDVSRWASGKRPIPLHFAFAIERATKGAVTRKAMFPDVWQSIWPELKRVS